MAERCSCDESRKWRTISRFFALRARYHLLFFTAPSAGAPKLYREWRRKLKWIQGRAIRLGKQIERF